jgi:hypothetical protein
LTAFWYFMNFFQHIFLNRGFFTFDLIFVNLWTVFLLDWNLTYNFLTIKIFKLFIYPLIVRIWLVILFFGWVLGQFHFEYFLFFFFNARFQNLTVSSYYRKLSIMKNSRATLAYLSAYLNRWILFWVCLFFYFLNLVFI